MKDREGREPGELLADVCMCFTSWHEYEEHSDATMLHMRMLIAHAAHEYLDCTLAE